MLYTIFEGFYGIVDHAGRMNAGLNPKLSELLILKLSPGFLILRFFSSSASRCRPPPSKKTNLAPFRLQNLMNESRTQSQPRNTLGVDTLKTKRT